MSDASKTRSAEFLKIADQFRLGSLTTESSHPVTANLSETAAADIAAGLDLLFRVDEDVLRKYEEFATSEAPSQITETLVEALLAGGRLFFTGCGSTGRLSIQLASIWREFWQRQQTAGLESSPSAAELEDRAWAVMAGGDFALIKAVEGFEDYAEFGKKQLGDLGLSERDVVFAITEGGETSFVIGTAWKAVEVGAKTYFVYNNPDEVLRATVTRSREVLDEPRIQKVNLTTGPMGITGSTRMQATSIQLAVMLTVLEMTVRELLRRMQPDKTFPLEATAVPQQFVAGLRQMHRTLRSEAVLSRLAELTRLEETVYRAGGKNNYFADHFGIDVLTDTTERSPTYCTPPFRRFDDYTASESWAYLFVAAATTSDAWRWILKREPRCVEWTEEEVAALVPDEKRARIIETIKKISRNELMRFRVGLDGVQFREPRKGDCAVGILSEYDNQGLESFPRSQLDGARAKGAKTGLIYFGSEAAITLVRESLKSWSHDCAVLVPTQQTGFLLDGVTRVGLKMLLNTLSTCTMVRLGRVMGNYMIWVVPSNLKLIDRATRYIEKLTELSYKQANELLFEVIEYVEPRMKADQAYPPVVGVAVLRARDGIANEEAEDRINIMKK